LIRNRFLIYWISALLEAFLKITAVPSLELSLGHSPIIFTVNNKIMTKGKSYTPCNTKMALFPEATEDYS